MTTATLLFALVGSLQGGYVQSQTTAAPVVTTANSATPSTSSPPPNSGSVPQNLGPVYPDQQDPNCVVGQACSTGTLVPQIRGLCVLAGGSNWCWDACNLNHTVGSYSTTNTAGIALMVKQLRTGMRFGSCPGASFTPTCNPGDRCTPPGLTWGRGMCVTQVGKGNQCLDMCNTKIPLTTFKATPGKQAGTVQIVEMVRAGRDPAGLTTCPMASVWVWLWIPILLCCSIGLCALAYWMFNFYRSRLKRGSSKGYREPVDEPFVDAPYVDYDNVAPQAYQQDLEQMPPQGMEPMPQTMEQMDQADPMPVIDAGAYEVAAPAAAPPAFEQQMQPNLFDQPNLMAGLAPVTQLQPMGTVFPAAAAPLTLGTYQAGSMSVAGSGFGAGLAPQYAASPQYASSMMATPTYGAYGAYGGAVTTQYPGTTSMRIG